MNPTVVLFHGFTSSPQGLEGLTAALEQRGCITIAPYMLSYAGPRALERFAPEQWLLEAEEVCGRILDQPPTGPLVLAGHSLGGVLCRHLASNSPLAPRLTEQVAAWVFMATPCGIDAAFLKFWQETSSAVLEWPFPVRVGLWQFLKKIDELPLRINQPALVVQGGADRHIPPTCGRLLWQKLGGEPHHHYISHPLADHFFVNRNEPGACLLQEAVVDFIEGVMQK